MLTLTQLQEQVLPWTAHNFPNKLKHQPLLGITEEVGELCHAHLKEEQGIRGTPEEHQEEAKDAIGDLLIYMADYCNQRGFHLQEIMESTWATVSQRDWKKDPHNG